MPTKIFMASAEETRKSCPPLNKHGVRYRLATYFYLRNAREDKINTVLYDTDPADPVVFIDSGAFTAMTSKKKVFEADPEKFWTWAEQYVEDYCQFLHTHRKRIFCAAEMDFDDLFTHDDIYNTTPEKWADGMMHWWNNDKGFSHVPPPVLAWRKMLEQTGVAIVPVWHAPRRWEGWVEDTLRGKYMALSSTALGNVARTFPYLNEAMKHKTPVHGLGLTKPDFIRKFPFYSVDSTTWLDGSKYGTTILFQNGRLRYFEVKHASVRKKYRKMYEAWDLDWKKIEAGDAYEMDSANLVAWIQYAEFIERSPGKDYWVKEGNGAPLGSLGPVRGKKGGAPPPEEPIDFVPKRRVNGGTVPLQDDPDEAAPPAEDPSEPVSSDQPDPTDLPEVNAARSEEADATTYGNLLVCNTCVINSRCRYVQKDAKCHYNFQGDFSSAAGIVGIYTKLIEVQFQRVSFARIQEQADGGQLDRNLSTEIRSLENMMQGLKDLLSSPEDTEAVEVRAKGPGAVSTILAALLPKPRKTEVLKGIEAPPA